MYWPYEQDSVVGSLKSAGNVLLGVGRARLFCRSDPLAMRYLRDPPVQEFCPVTSSRQAVLQPIVDKMFRAPMIPRAMILLNQSTLTAAICRAVRMGLDREHEQPACSR